MKRLTNPGGYETRSYTIEGEAFTFECHDGDTYDGFGHHAVMYNGDGDEMAEAYAYYLNRTWERRKYDSVCASAVRKAEEAERERLRAEWMEEHGTRRMTKKYREMYEAEQPTSDLLRKLDTLKFAIQRMPDQYDHACGARETQILRDAPLDVRRVDTTPGHEVYRITGAGGESCEYDQITRRFVG